MRDLFAAQLGIKRPQLGWLFGGEGAAKRPVCEFDHGLKVTGLGVDQPLAEGRRAVVDRPAHGRELGDLVGTVLRGELDELLVGGHQDQRLLADVQQLVPQAIQLGRLFAVEHQPPQLVVFAIEQVERDHFVDRDDAGVTERGRKQLSEFVEGGRESPLGGTLRPDHDGQRRRKVERLRRSRGDLYLHARLAASLLVQAAGRDELAALDQVGRQSHNDRGRRLHAKTALVDGQAGRMFAKQRGIEAKVVVGSGRGVWLGEQRIAHRGDQRPAQRCELMKQRGVGESGGTLAAPDCKSCSSSPANFVRSSAEGDDCQRANSEPGGIDHSLASLTGSL